MAPKSLADLVSSITTNTTQYNEYLVSKGLPLPSHDVGNTSHKAALPDHISAAKAAATEATYELHSLLLGPMGLLLSPSVEEFKMLSMQYILRHKIAQAVHVDEEVSFEDLAKRLKLDVSDLCRVLRLAMTNHVFTEPREGVVAHTAASRMLAEKPLLAAWVEVVAEENWPAWTRVVDAMTRWPGSQEPTESSFTLAHGTDSNESSFDIWNRDPVRAKRFVDAMSFWHTTPAFSPEHFVSNFDFGTSSDDTAAPKEVFVDIGGSHGNVSIAVAKSFPQFRCIVQDLPTTVDEARNRLPADLKDRVEFMAHDFWTEQTVKDADIYYFRLVFHDWSDKYCVKLLRNLIPALKKGAHVVINDVCVPEFGESSMYAERRIRGMDMTMKAFSNAKERTATEWANLFKDADARFHFRGVQTPPNSGLAIMSAEWTGK